MSRVAFDAEFPLASDIAKRILVEEGIKMMSIMYHVDFNCGASNCHQCQDGENHACDGVHASSTHFDPAVDAFRKYNGTDGYLERVIPLLEHMDLEKRFANDLKSGGIKHLDWAGCMPFFQEYYTSLRGLPEVVKLIIDAPTVDVKTMAEWCFAEQSAPLRSGEVTANSDPWFSSDAELTLNC